MSADLLVHLADRYTFDASPSFGDLGAYHVPFDELVGTERVESRLTQAAERGERAVLVADSGSGKSTIISSVLGATAHGLAPIVVPVRPLLDRATSPAVVADELLALVSRYAEQVRDIEAIAGDTRVVIQRRRHTGGLRLALGWLEGDLARELMRQTATEQSISLREKTELLGQVLHRIHQDGLQPVVVFDDTDRWLADADADVVTGFFKDVVRWLTELPLSVVVAAHSRYLKPAKVRLARLESLDTVIEIPRLPDAAALAKILERRIELHVDDSDFIGADCDDVFGPGSVDTLFAAYNKVRSLRRVIQIVHASLAEATSAGTDLITDVNIKAIVTSL